MGYRVKKNSKKSWDALTADALEEKRAEIFQHVQKYQYQKTPKTINKGALSYPPYLCCLCRYVVNIVVV